MFPVDDLELIAAGLAAMAVVTDAFRRWLRRAFPRFRFSRWAQRLRRGMGVLEVALICLALLAVFELVIGSGKGAEHLESIVDDWQSRVEQGLPEKDARQTSSGQRQSLETASVVKVKDGDSLILRLSDRESVEARLYGIDAPEYSQAYGKAAKRKLSGKVNTRKVAFKEFDVDSYGRRVIVLYRKGRNINAEMVCEGYAWWYRHHARGAKDLEACEATARSDRLGLWRDDDPEPPWTWRQRQRNQSR